MDVQMLHALFYLLLAAIAVFTLLIVVSPYRIRQSQSQFASILPADIRAEMMTIGEAWGGKVKITRTQVWLLSCIALIVAPAAGFALTLVLDAEFAIGLAVVVGSLGFLYPHQKFKGGFPSGLLHSLEREAMLLTSFMYRARGVAGLSVQVAFSQFIAIYGDTETAALLRRIPEGSPYAEELLKLEFPAEQVPNWLNAISTLSSINDLGDPKEVLQKLRDQTRDKEIDYLRRMIKGKAFKAPALTVVIILPGLLAIMLGSIILQAVIGMGGTF